MQCTWSQLQKRTSKGQGTRCSQCPAKRNYGVQLQETEELQDAWAACIPMPGVPLKQNADFLAEEGKIYYEITGTQVMPLS